jgi:hypothetical protein
MVPGSLQQVSPNTLMTYNASQTPSLLQTMPTVSPKSAMKPVNEKLSKKPARPVKQVDTESSDDEPLYASKDEDSDDDDEVSTAKQKLIQSNKIDSSGLKATPPHPTDETDQKMASPGLNRSVFRELVPPK